MGTRVIVFIDGFNFYHSLENLKCNKYKWIDYSKLATFYLNEGESIEKIYYFTALCPWDPNKQKRHRILIRALEYTGIQPVYGEFKKRKKTYKNYRVEVTLKYHEEKQTDVNIAVYLLRLAIEDKYDTALIISGDTDFSPAVIAVKELFPEKKIGTVSPIGRRSFELEKMADFHKLIREKHIAESLLPDTINIGKGKTLHCPAEWK